MRLIIFVCFFSLTTTAFGQVYRSVDKEGNVVYSDIPPDNAEKTESLALPEDISEKKRKEAQQDLKRLLDTTDTETSAEPEQAEQPEQAPGEVEISESDQSRIQELEKQIANTVVSRKGSRRKRRNRILNAESELSSIYNKYGMEYQSQYRGMGFQKPDEELEQTDE